MYVLLTRCSVLFSTILPVADLYNSLETIRLDIVKEVSAAVTYKSNSVNLSREFPYQFSKESSI